MDGFACFFRLDIQSYLCQGTIASKIAPGAACVKVVLYTAHLSSCRLHVVEETEFESLSVLLNELSLLGAASHFPVCEFKLRN